MLVSEAEHRPALLKRGDENLFHDALKRFASPEEMAHFFVFLCSDKASYSVGSTYFVDGGMLKTV